MAKHDETFSILKDGSGRMLALQGVNVHARLSGLLAEVEVEQSYANPSKKNIETVYTFPLPLGAVLLGLEVDIAGKKLAGKVIERKKAERDYEDAITDGNSAVILQEASPGLYTVSIGNLMARESAVIRYRYALLLSWKGPQLRFLLPTTIAPRYGDAIAAGLEPHQVPMSSMQAQYPLGLTVVVEGALASASIASPTHPIAFEKRDQGIAARLVGQAALDRDFVLTLESDGAQSACALAPDGEQHVALASIRIPPATDTDGKPLAMKLIIDCSGSMSGTSIRQARKAALEILNALQPADRFNVTLFGSECKHLFPRMAKATRGNISKAWSRLENLMADMGGTEMESALESAFALGGEENSPCVLLITDGQIHNHEKLVQRASASAHRIFTVGVGSAVAAAFLESLAAATGGACELVSPQEGMAEKILSQFYRLRQPHLGQISVDWPSTPLWTTPLPKAAFAGDTVHVFAGFGQAIDGSVTLRTSMAGQTVTVPAPSIHSADHQLPRIAAASRLEDANRGQVLALALRYQLLSKWTSYLVVAEREAKADDLPQIHQVPQMLAAGWGGTGDIALIRKSMRMRETPPVALPFAGMDVDSRFELRSSREMLRELAHLDHPAVERAGHTSPRQFVERLEEKVLGNGAHAAMPSTLAELDDLGLEETMSREIRRHIDNGHDEAAAVTAFLHAMIESAVQDLFGRNLKRHILKRWKEVNPHRFLAAKMAGLLVGIKTGSWL